MMRMMSTITGVDAHEWQVGRPLPYILNAGLDHRVP